MRKKFDKVDTFNDKPITLSYKHLFEYEVDPKTGDWSGFHHDLLGGLEQQGKCASEILHTTADGFYATEVTINGIMKPKTCFPKHMSRSEVCEMIINGYKASKHTAEFQPKSGLWRIKHKVSNEVELYIYIRKTGYINTVVPRIEGKK